MTDSCLYEEFGWTEATRLTSRRASLRLEDLGDSSISSLSDANFQVHISLTAWGGFLIYKGYDYPSTASLLSAPPNTLVGRTSLCGWVYFDIYHAREVLTPTASPRAH
jgi:hypothetical protein